MSNGSSLLLHTIFLYMCSDIMPNSTAGPEIGKQCIINFIILTFFT